MAWRVDLTDSAAKQLRKLNPQVTKGILSFLDDRVATLDDPRSIGEALRGKQFGDFWKYRVGDWRIIASLDDGVLLVTVVRIGNRREVYRRQEESIYLGSADRSSNSRSTQPLTYEAIRPSP